MRRVWTSVILSLLLFLGLFIHSFFWLVFIVGFGMGGAWEFTRIYFRERLHAVSAMVVFAALLFPLNAWLRAEGHFNIQDTLLISIFFVLAPTLFVMSHGTLEEFKQDVPMAFFGTLWVAWLLSFQIPIYYLKVHGFLYGIQNVFFFAFVVCGNDVGAYYFGSAFGKHKLSEVYSPKKTWEGLLGGLVFALLLAFLSRFYFVPEYSVFDTVMMTVVMVVAGTFGDLVESVFKRSCAVKDAGEILPGHGGLMDRMDSILFATPAFYWYLLYVVPR